MSLQTVRKILTLGYGWRCECGRSHVLLLAINILTYTYRFSFDSVGAVFFGQPFGFLETSLDYGNYIAAVHTAMPMSSVIAMAPLWCRGYLLQMGVMIPKVFKAIMAVDGIGQTAVRETGVAPEKRAEADMHRTDVLSQLLGIMREKRDSLSIEKFHVEMWAAV